MQNALWFDANRNAFLRRFSFWFDRKFVMVWQSMFCKIAKNNAYLKRDLSSFQIREYFNRICKDAWRILTHVPLLVKMALQACFVAEWAAPFDCVPTSERCGDEAVILRQFPWWGDRHGPTCPSYRAHSGCQRQCNGRVGCRSWGRYSSCPSCHRKPNQWVLPCH